MDIDRSLEWACTRLIYRFAAASDAGRWEEVASLFVHDGVFARPAAPDHPVQGRDEILRAFQQRPPRITRHVVSNVIITAEKAGEARAESLVQLLVADEEGCAKPPLIGEFRDRLVETAEGWKFLERRGRLVFKT